MIRRRFSNLSMHFLVVGGIVMIIAMVVAGYLITAIVAGAAIRGKAASTALFMHAITGEVVSELATTDKLSATAIAKLNELFASEQFRKTYPYLDIWTNKGVIAYSNSIELIGKRFPAPDGLQRALQGEVAAEYSDLDATEHMLRGLDNRHLEIYSPIREPTGRMIAVAEIHEVAEPLQRRLAHLTTLTWAIVAGSTLVIAASLFGVVHRGSRTIERQAAALQSRIEETERISEQNRELKDRARRASATVSELNEKSLKGIGADLHDGPSQLLGFAILQTNHLAGIDDVADREKSMQTLRSTLIQTLEEIRRISKGLLIPDIESLSLQAIVENVAKIHQARTKTKVALDFDGVDLAMPLAVTTCVYRFVHEGLTNSYRHAAGNGQTVICRLQGTELVVAVSDTGSSTLRQTSHSERGMGLFGLRNRVESIGGTMSFQSLHEGGSRLEMRLEMNDGGLRG